MRGKGIGYNLLILRFFLPENISKPLIDDFLPIILQGPQLPNLPPLIIIPFLSISLLGRQLQITQCTQ